MFRGLSKVEVTKPGEEFQEVTIKPFIDITVYSGDVSSGSIKERGKIYRNLRMFSCGLSRNSDDYGEVSFDGDLKSSLPTERIFD